MISLAPQPVLFVGPEPSTPHTMHEESCVLVVADGPSRASGALDYTLTLAHTQALDIGQLQQDVLAPLPSLTCQGGFLTRRGACAAAPGLPKAIPCDLDSLFHTIIATARQHACEAIIFGWRAAAGWQRLVAHGVARGILAQSDIPVLAARHAQLAFV